MAQDISEDSTISQPRLPQLLALAKSSKSWQEKLIALRKITEIPDGSFDHPNTFCARPGRQAQDEWIFRYLLENLRQNEPKEYARQDADTWSLLRQILPYIPAAIVAKHMNGNEFLTVLEEVLVGLGPMLELKETKVDSRAEASSSRRSEDDTPSSPSRKRKRGEESPSQPEKTLSIASDKSLLYVAIWNFITTLFSLSTSGYWSQDRIARARLQSVWRTDTRQAAIVARYLLNSIYCLHKNGQVNFIANVHLAVALQIWKLRRETGEEENHAAMRLFCDEVLIPVVNLVGYGMERSTKETVSKIQGLCRASTIKGSALNIEAMRSLLTELVGKNFLTPARVAFKAAQASRTPETFDFSVLRSVLANLRLALTSGTDNDTAKTEKTRLVKLDSGKDDVSTALQDVMDYAVKDCKTSAGVVQDADIAWIESLIAVFAECLGFPLTGVEIEPLADPSQIGGLFNVNEGRKLRINPEMLEELLKRYAGLSIPRAKQYLNVSGEPAWPLIRTVMEMNGDVFLDKRRSTSSAIANRVSIDYRKALLSSLAKARLTQGDPLEEDIIVSGVIIGLMDAHIAARDFKGFIAAWHQGIAAGPDEIHYVDYGDAKPIPVWTSRILVDTVRRRLETVMTSTQIVQLVNDYMVHLITVSNQGPEQSESQNSTLAQKSADAAAAFYIINVILTSIESDELTKQLQPTLLALNRLICSFLSNGQDDQPLTSCWYLIRQVYQLISLETTPEALDAIRAEYFSMGLISGAQSRINSAADSIDTMIRDAREHFKAPPPAPREASDAAYHFIVTISAASIDNETNVEEAQQALVGANAHIFEATASWSWDPAPDSLFVSYLLPELERCISAMVQYPQLLLAIRKEQRVALFHSLLTATMELTSLDHPASRETKVQSRHSIMALAETILQTGDVKLRDDFMHDLVTGIAIIGAKPSREEWPQIAMMLNIVSVLRPGSMSRKDRESTLDWLLSQNNFGFGLSIQIFGLATEILRSPVLTSKICADPELMADVTTWFGSEDGGSPALGAFSAFVKAVFRQVFADPQTERKMAFIKKMNKIMIAKANKIAGKLEVSGDESSDASQEFMELSICWLEVFDSEDLKSSVSQKMVAAILKAFTGSSALIEAKADSTPHGWMRYVVRLYAILKSLDQDSARSLQTQFDQRLSSFSRRDMDEPRANSGLAGRVQPINESSEDMDWDIGATAREWRIATAKEVDALHLCKSINDVGLLLHDDKVKARQALSLVDTLQVQLKSLTNETRADSLVLASKMMKEQRDQVSRVVPIIIRDLEVFKEDEELLAKLQAYLPGLLSDIRDTADAESWRRRLYCVQIILKYKTWMITQYSIDTLLTTLTYVTSPSCEIVGAIPAEIFHQTCKTLQLLISSHRRRLNGRMHLLVPLLQGLMTCQFEPHSKYSADKRPSWARTRSEFQPRIQAAEQATPLAAEYARLLTTLADPTVSAISSHHKNRKRLDLVDQTKKARDHFGMFAPNLITHFCSLQLNGYVEPEAREAMNPGLWACIDVIGEEGMSVMNDAMGRDVRALWHTLHSGYKRARDRRG